jgi:hypothetical protein
MRVPTGRKKMFSIFTLDFLPPLRGLEFFAIESRYFQIVPFGTKFPLDRKICSTKFPAP